MYVLRLLVNNQPDALFHVFIYSFHLSTYFEHQVLIRRSKCINISSGMISLCRRLLGMPVLTEDGPSGPKNEGANIRLLLVVVVVLVFSLWASLGRNQSPVRRPVWLWYTASWASS